MNYKINTNNPTNLDIRRFTSFLFRKSRLNKVILNSAIGIIKKDITKYVSYRSALSFNFMEMIYSVIYEDTYILQIMYHHILKSKRIRYHHFELNKRSIES